MMAGKGPGLTDMAKFVHKKMDFSTALRQLHGKLPKDVASLIHMTSSGKGGGAFDEDSMQKARKILNKMMLDAWGELDDVVFECKEFEERNRGTYEQVVADLARLGSQLSKLGELRVTANQGITNMDRERKDAEATLEKETTQFKETRFVNGREMTVRKNDLAVFDFILKATQCKENFFLQMEGKHEVQICQDNSGPILRFDNPNMQSRLEQMMTPDALHALRSALGQAQGPLGLIQLREDPTETTTALPTFAAETIPVSEDPHPSGQWKKMRE